MISPAIREALATLGSGSSLSSLQARDAVESMLSDDGDSVGAAAILTALHLKGIAAEELSGAVDAIRRRMIPLDVSDALRPILDTCGTGGDGANSVNISTAAAIVVAACGVRVAKHGNRSATGNSGSSEVLHHLGVKFDADPNVLLNCLEVVGITFLFAPRFHPSLKVLAPIRKALPFRTIFNSIGPLVNPATPDAQVLGVPTRAQVILMSSVLMGLTSDASSFRGFVVAGEDGLDEVTLAGNTTVFATAGIDQGERVWTPEDFGLPRSMAEDLAVTGPAESAGKILEMLGGERGPVRDVVLANSAAALFLVGKASALAEGVALAAEAIDDGRAGRLLKRWATLSQS